MTSSSIGAGGPITKTAAPRAPAGPGRLPSLTGMRFLCAAMVFGMHAALLQFFTSTDTGNKFIAIAVQGGYTGVVYFFILSGFVLTWSARSGDRLAAFWRRRVVKIYPNYLLALIAGMVVTVFIQGMVFNRRTAVLDLLLVQSWSPNLLTRSAYNGPLWSLSCEALFYLSFPLLLRLVDRVRPERLWNLVGVLVVGIFAVPVVAHALPSSGPPVFGLTATESWLVNQLPATRMLEFVLGIVMARIVLTGRRLPLGLGGGVALAMAAYWLASYVPVQYTVVAIMVVPLCLVIAAAAVQDEAGRPSLVSNRVWVWLGEVSFAFYLLHFPVLSTAKYLLHGRTLGTWTGIGLMVALFALTTVLAALQHMFVERPMMKHFSRSRRDRDAAAAERAAAAASAATQLPAEPALAEGTLQPALAEDGPDDGRWDPPERRAA